MKGGDITMAKRLLKSSPAVALRVVLFALAAANVLLIRQNLQLRAALSRYEPEVTQPGDRLPPFSAKGSAGEPLRIAYDGRGPHRVFFFFTPTCPYCRKQFARWREVLSKADRARFEVWVLSRTRRTKAESTSTCAPSVAAPTPRPRRAWPTSPTTPCAATN